MNLKRKPENRIIALTVIIGILVTSIAIIVNFPSETPHSVFNIKGSGYSLLYKTLNAKAITNIGELSEGTFSSHLIIIPLHRELTYREENALLEYAARGATLVILDEHGFSNHLLLKICPEASVQSTPVLDEVNKHGGREHPLVKVHANSSDIITIITFTPAYINAVNCSNNAFIRGETSNYSYTDLDGNNFYSLGEDMKAYTIIYGVKLGKGAIIVMADLEIASNNLLQKADNTELFKTLSEGKVSYIYAETLELSALDRAKLSLISLQIAQHAELELITELILLVIISMVILYVDQKED